MHDVYLSNRQGNEGRMGDNYRHLKAATVHCGGLCVALKVTAAHSHHLAVLVKMELSFSQICLLDIEFLNAEMF